MPIDPSILLKSQPLQISDPIEQYGRALSLRQMMDQRRYREQQLQAQQLQLQEKQREQTEYEAFKGGLQQGKSLSELTAISPTRGIAYGKAQAEQTKATREAEEADAKLKRQQREEMFRARASLLQEKDPAKRAALFKQHTDAFVNKGWLTPEQALEPMDDEPTMQRELVGLYGPQALEEWVTKRATEKRAVAKEERDEALFPYKTKQAIGEAISAENKALGTEPITPYQQAQLRHDQLRLQRMGLPNTPAELAMVASDPKRTPEERATAESALERLTKYQLSARPAISLSEADADRWARLIGSGQSTLTQVPMSQRKAVIAKLDESGMQIVTPKQREGLSAMDTASSMVKDLEEKALRANKKYGLYAVGTGAYQRALARAQSDPEAQAMQRTVGLLGNLARSISGERGVLTEGDVQRVMSLIPQLGDSEVVTRDKISDLRKFIANKQNALLGETGRVYKQGETGQEPAAPSSLQRQQPKATHRFNPATGKIEPIR